MKVLDPCFDFNSIICLNGDISHYDVEFLQFAKSLNSSIPIIVADGAINKLYLYVSADYIVGDLDSIDSSNENICNNVKIIKEENQNKYDFEKALDFAIDSGFTSILILGMNGGEMEHSLNNWSIFIKYSSKIKLACLTNNRIGFFVSESVGMKLGLGEIVSIIPANEVVISSKGLEWGLEHSRLKLGLSEGARNRTVSTQVELILHSGSCVLFINAC